jgi:transcriptional regulator with AAA-type ATPase domain
MTELSNAVTVLIARMESHPEDFAVDDGELYSKSKFGDMVNGLYALSEVDTSLKNAFWYLNDADKQALADAWKKYHYTRFEKRVMEKIFDDGAEERERVKMRQQMYQTQQRAQLQNSLMQSTGTYQTTTIKPGQLIPMSNSAQNTTIGLLGQAGSAFQGLFK